MDDVEEFLLTVSVDETAAQELREASKEVQQQVLSRGGLSRSGATRGPLVTPW